MAPWPRRLPGSGTDPGLPLVRSHPAVHRQGADTCRTLPGFPHFGTKWGKLEEPQVHKGAPSAHRLGMRATIARKLGFSGNSLEDCVEIRCVGSPQDPTGADPEICDC